MHNVMHSFTYRITKGRKVRSVVAAGRVKASRIAVAAKRAAEHLPDERGRKGVWFHVAVKRTS